MATPFQFKKFEFKPYELPDFMKERTFSWQTHFIGEEAYTKAPYESLDAYTKAFDDRIAKATESNLDADYVAQLSTLKDQFLNTYKDADKYNSAVSSAWAANTLASQEIKDRDLPASSFVKQPVAYSGSYNPLSAFKKSTDILKQFYLAEQNASQIQQQRRSYESERSLAETQHKAAEQRVLFENQNQISRINQDAAAQQTGTGLAYRLLGGTAAEATSSASASKAATATALSTSVGINTEDELKRKRGLSSAIGINL